MTKEQVEERKAQLVQELQSILEQMHQLRGAILDCDFWLSRFDDEAG